MTGRRSPDAVAARPPAAVPRPARRARRRRSAVAALVLAAAGLAACGGDAADDPQRFSAGGVDASVRLAGWDGTRGSVGVTLTPEDGYHLYGAGRPRGGIDGVGQRTEVRVRGALRSAGAATVDARVRSLRIRGIARPVPVYPEGRIRVELPVRRRSGTDGEATASLSYGACSARTCRIPVVDRRVRVAVP